MAGTEGGKNRRGFGGMGAQAGLPKGEVIQTYRVLPKGTQTENTNLIFSCRFPSVSIPPMGKKVKTQDTYPNTTSMNKKPSMIIS